MKIVLGLVGVLTAMLLIFLFVGFGVAYTLIFINFSGPRSVVEPCFKAGFTCGLICALSVGSFVCRYFWTKYSSADPE
jgi:hypothetical protein